MSAVEKSFIFNGSALLGTARRSHLNQPAIELGRRSATDERFGLQEKFAGPYRSTGREGYSLEDEDLSKTRKTDDREKRLIWSGGPATKSGIYSIGSKEWPNMV
jgi:hypothetical protein